jgi:uncharacterized repeat protein (TIGR01451 family)
MRTLLTSGAAVTALSIGILGLGIAPVQAAPTQSASVTISPATQSHNTGTPQTYSIALSCQGTGASACGPNTTVTIPLDTRTNPSMTDPSWNYAATSGLAGLITSGPTVVGNNLVITLDDTTFVGGFSGTISLTATPPNDVTPNDTSWTVSPTVTGGNIDPVTADVPAQSTATAAPVPVITKTTTNGGTVFEAGQNVDYTISATCNLSASGSLQFENGSLVDDIPDGMTYVSSTPTATHTGSTLTWNFPDVASTPAGCAPGAAGTNTYHVTLQAPETAPPGAEQPVVNHATFSGTGADATDPDGISVSTDATAPVQIVDGPSTGPGAGYASISKTALAPLGEQVGGDETQYVSTYPGDWLPASSTPSYTVGAAAASFQATVGYGLVNSYQTTVVDPLPCLDNASGNIYSSADYTAAACADPAFHPTVIEVTSAGFDAPNNGLGAALNSSWRPQATLTDGSPLILDPDGTVGPNASSAYFTIPAGSVDSVATITLPPNAALMNKSIQLTLWGYTDASLAGLHDSVNQLHNVATAIPQLDGTPLEPTQDAADIFTEPTDIQLGVSKSFGGTGAGPSGTTVVNIKGAVRFGTPSISKDVVLTDLLPAGMSWHNPTTDGQFTLSAGGDSDPVTAQATTQYLENYEGSGRDLIRMTIPADDFAAAGSWTITPPANYIEVTTPTVLGVYANTDQIFLAGSGSAGIAASCSDPAQTQSGHSTVQFETDNPFDLAGDGQLNESHCENSASLQISGTGAAFALTKSVQGNLDSIPRGALGIGSASDGGSGVYGLDWSNVGSDDLNNAVIYDILPHVGDTGVSEGQSGTMRGSAFTPVFTGVGTLPTDVSVQYSTSTNPCRDEVYADADNPTCDDDWGAAPSDLGDVTALRFISTDSYAPGEGFDVSISIALPDGVVNKVAWNSAATNAQDVSDPSRTTLPAEPPKVGIVASTTPTITTSTSDAVVAPHTDVSDTVTIVGTGGNAGSLAWRLVGPVTPVDGKCTNVDWTDAGLVNSDTTTIEGDGTVTTGPSFLNAPGCYGWADALTPVTAGDFPTPDAIEPGAPNEVTQLSLRTPTITTKAASVTSGKSRIVHDAITLRNTGLGAVPASPTEAALNWTLRGPVAPVSGSCRGVNWGSAPTAGSGTLTVTGDGEVQTPDTTIDKAGCYTFSESLAGTADSVAVSTDPGVAVETVLLPGTVTGGLAFTGFDALIPVLGALLFLLLGAVIMLLRRRRGAA